MKTELKFNDDELNNISLLLDSGLNLKEVLEIVKDEKNFKLIDEILIRLDKGERVEEIINNCINKKISVYLKSFMYYLSFNVSLKLALSMYKKTKQMKNLIYKTISYPLFLIIFCITGVYLFNNFFFEQLITMIASFDLDLSNIYFFKMFLDNLINILLIFSLLCFLILKLSINDKTKIIFYLKINRIFKNNLYKIYATHLFVIFYIECLKQGLKTKECMEILSKLKYQKFISFFAYHIDDSFSKGIEYSDAIVNYFVDQKLKKFLKISKYMDNKIEILSTYLEINQRLFESYIKRLGVFLQVFSYILIFVVVYFIYNILLMPIGILERF